MAASASILKEEANMEGKWMNFLSDQINQISYCKIRRTLKLEYLKVKLRQLDQMDEVKCLQDS